MVSEKEEGGEGRGYKGGWRGGKEEIGDEERLVDERGCEERTQDERQSKQRSGESKLGKGDDKRSLDEGREEVMERGER